MGNSYNTPIENMKDVYYKNKCIHLNHNKNNHIHYNHMRNADRYSRNGSYRANGIRSS